jgi:hypothetical protein
MTFWGALVSLTFVGCYVGMAMSTGMEGAKAQAVKWGCWLLACAVILLCYSISPNPAG